MDVCIVDGLVVVIEVDGCRYEMSVKVVVCIDGYVYIEGMVEVLLSVENLVYEVLYFVDCCDDGVYNGSFFFYLFIMDGLV